MKMTQLILKYVLILFFVQISFGYCYILQDKISDRPKIIGEISWKQWQKSAGWNDYSAIKYQPNPKKINKLKSLIKDNNPNFIIFASSFCDECMHEVPILFKLLELAELDSSKVKLVGLDENLQEPGGIFKDFDLKSVPTLIILSDNKVIGKVEPPDNEWLEFLIEFLENFQKEKK